MKREDGDITASLLTPTAWALVLRTGADTGEQATFLRLLRLLLPLVSSPTLPIKTDATRGS